ncbi:MAG: hypothetical protein U0Z53_22115 [Blastocatellia bacterium]
MKRPFALFNQSSILRFSKVVLTLGALSAALWIAACKRSGGDHQFFVKKGCVQCHSISAFDIKSQTNVGPDLSYAVEDAPKRFGKSLDMFWQNPTGTMQLVLSSQIKLTPEEKEQALDLLKEAYEKRPQKAQK